MMSYSNWNIIIFSALITKLNALTITIPVKVFRMEKFYQCPHNNGFPINYTDIVLSQTRENVVDVSANIYITTTVGGPSVNALAELYKCQSKDDLETCEYYTRIKLNEVCNQYKIWNDFLKYTDFPKDCPIPTGNYSINHAVFDLGSAKYLPLFEGYWRMKGTIFDHLEILSCINTEFSIEEKRRKQDISG